jgi:ABC-type amino acid transport substrate-binding protein
MEMARYCNIKETILFILILYLLVRNTYLTRKIAQLLAAINAAIGQLNADGTLSSLRSKYIPSELQFRPSCLDGSGSYPSASPTGALAQVISSGSLRLGRQFPNPPNNYINSTSGSAAGFEYELGLAIASKLSTQYSKTITVQWIDGTLATLATNLRDTNDLDAILGSAVIGLTRTWLAPSCSYGTTQLSYMIKNTSSLYETITSELQLNDRFTQVAVSAGTIGETWARANIPNADIIAVSTLTELYECILNDTAEVIVRPEPFNSAWLMTQPDPREYRITTFGDPSFQAVFVRKDACPTTTARNVRIGNQELLDAVDRALNNLRKENILNSVLISNNASSPAHLPTCGAPVSNFTQWPTPSTGGTLAAVIAAGTILVGRTYPNAPFSYQQAASIGGVDVDLLNQITAILSAAYSKTINVTWVDTTLTNLFADPNADQFDLIAAGIGNSYSRFRDFSFSCSYASLQPSYVIGTKNTTLRDLALSVSDLNVPSATVGVLAGSTTATYANANLPLSTRVFVATTSELYQGVSNGTFDAILRQDPNNAFWVASSGSSADYKTGLYGNVFPISFGVRRDLCAVSTPVSAPVIVTAPVAASSPVGVTAPRVNSAASFVSSVLVVAFAALMALLL